MTQLVRLKPKLPEREPQPHFRPADLGVGDTLREVMLDAAPRLWRITGTSQGWRWNRRPGTPVANHASEVELTEIETGERCVLGARWLCSASRWHKLP